ncbi:MAG: EamA family transporter [Woeseiaceae bacterium]
MSNGLLYLITVLIWGSTWFAIEFQLGVVAPEISIVYRFFLASGILLIWCKYRKLNLKFDVKYHLWFALLGAFLFCLNYILAYRAQVHITSALAAIVFSTMLWMNILLARLAFGTRVTLKVVTGGVLGMIGIVVLFAPQIEALSLTDRTLYGSLLALAGAASASAGNIVSQAAQKRTLPVVATNTWAMFYGALFTAVAALLQGQQLNFDATFTYIASLAYLALFGSVVAFGAYLTLIGRIGAHRAGYAMVMFPVVALVLSIAFEGLRLSWAIVVGTSLVLLGNLLVLNRDT